MANIRAHEIDVTGYALERLARVPDVSVYGPLDPHLRTCVVSFNLDGVHPHDAGTILDEAGIAYVHVPLGPRDELVPRLEAVYGTLVKLLDDPEEKLFVHHEEFGDRLLGVMGGVLAFGFVGLFIGPTLLAVALGLLRNWTCADGAAAG